MKKVVGTKYSESVTMPWHLTEGCDGRGQRAHQYVKFIPHKKN